MVSLGNELVFVNRGSFITSEIKLMQRWGWGKEKTRNFLKMLQDDGMIIKISDRKKTTIIILNYND
jgi:DNA replication protein DnaD